MTKKLVIVAALMTFCGGAMAQDEGTSGGGFSSGISLNTNNKFQISLMLGNSGLFDQDMTYNLTPKYGDDELGLGWNGDGKSVGPESYLNLNQLGQNSILNLAGISFGYRIIDAIDINMSFAMDLRSTPKKDYVENENVAGMNIQGSKWIEGQVKNNWLLTVGGNYHFAVSNERIDFYGGVQAGYQHGQITTTTPYTKAEYQYLYEENGDAEAETLYYPRSGAGQINCITAAIVAGVGYSLTDGLSLGVEFAPYSFQYSMLEVCPKGNRVYQAAHYANRFFASPMLKLGFRF
jgi:hypothetical protein